MNDNLTPNFVKNQDPKPSDRSSDQEIPGQYKIVETIYDNDDEDEQLDLRQNLDVELISLDKNIMDLYDMHKKDNYDNKLSPQISLSKH